MQDTVEVNAKCGNDINLYNDIHTAIITIFYSKIIFDYTQMPRVITIQNGLIGPLMPFQIV